MKTGYSGMTKSETREWRNNLTYKEQLQFDMDNIDTDSEPLPQHHRLICLTGAGISKESGINTFEEFPELRDKLHRHYAYTHKEDYEKTIQEFMKMIEGKEPNSAHYAMAQSPFQQVPIITQNVDGLHQLAGSENVIELHGRLPDTIVLYGDSAPMYQVAIDCVKDLKYNDSYFVIVGTSFTTTIASDLLKIAKQKKAKVFVINDNAGERVPKILSNIRHELGW